MAHITKAQGDARRETIDDLFRCRRPLTYSRAVDLNAEELGEQIALVDRRTRLTWSEVRSISDKLALAMLERGVMRPDIALLHLSNSAEQYLIRLACEKAGIRVLLTNSAFRETELVSLIRRTDPAIAFLSGSKALRGDYDRLRGALDAEGRALDAVLVGEELAMVDTGNSWGQPYRALLAQAPSTSPRILDRTRFGWDGAVLFDDDERLDQCAENCRHDLRQSDPARAPARVGHENRPGRDARRAAADDIRNVRHAHPSCGTLFCRDNSA